MAIMKSKTSSAFKVRMESVKIQPVYNPESVVKYFSRGVKTGRCKDSDLVLNVKRHLSALGWSFNVVFKAPGKKELRYRSPAGKNFVTLIRACETLVDCNGCYIHNLESGGFKKPAKKTERLGNGVDLGCVKIRSFEKPEKELEKFDQISKKKLKKDDDDDDDDLDGFNIEEFSRELENQLVNCDYDVDLGGSVIDEVRETEPKSVILGDGDSLDSFKIDEFSRELELQLVSDEENRPKKKIRVEDFPVTVENKICGGKKIQDMKRLIECGKPEKVIRKTKGISRPRCVLSLLIEKGVVLRGSNVSYKKKNGTVIAKGRIYEEGIQCNCCGLFFLLSKFEAHAGSTYRRPAAYLFLDDNRSLFDCQAVLNLNRENKPSKVSKSIKPADFVIGNDEFCLFCKQGGDLLLCDLCSSAFHSTCVGVKGVPESDFWFCPACSCGICHQGSQSSKSTTKEQIKCVQCEHYYHINCLKKLGFSVSIDSAKWLCSEKCERINLGLTGILGKSISLPVDSLSWRLLKSEKDMCKYTETYSNLLAALDVMHECFQPVKHPWSDNDLIEDIIFSKSSKRSTFEGFFTAVLEKDEEIVTAVSVRIHGSKVAEIPLVATRFQFRKLGMCRILMNELERKLGDLGVERLVLPAVPEMIGTWTESFGFSVMTKPERLDVVKCKFVEFPGTIKCQKMLKKM